MTRDKLLRRREQVQGALEEARVLVEHGRFDEALALYITALDWSTGRRRAAHFEEIGKLHLQLGRFAEAFEAYGEAVRLYDEAGESEAARTLAIKMTRLAPPELQPDGEACESDAEEAERERSPSAESVEAFYDFLGAWGQQICLCRRDGDALHLTRGRIGRSEGQENEALVEGVERLKDVLGLFENGWAGQPRWVCMNTTEGVWIWFGTRECSALGMIEAKALGMTLSRARALAEVMA